MPKPQLQPAAALVIMLDTHTIRHIGAAASRWPAMLSTSSSINTAVGEMTARTTIEHSCSRIAATSDASDATNGMAGASGWGG